MGINDRIKQRNEAKAAQAYAASPPGQAVQAYHRGDQVFQYDAAQTAPMRGTPSGEDRLSTLNEVCAQGWELVTGSFLSHAAGGVVNGFYLFKRNAAMRPPA